MRPIKFRAWDNEENKWYEPVFEAYQGKLHDLNISLSGRLSARVIDGIIDESLFEGRYTIMQFTGLKDKNGNEIYEGDIVHNSRWNPEIYQVGFDRGGFCFYNKGYEYCHDAKYLEDFIVIGNIYQHKHLLT